jgi:hypothetical protein
MIIAILQGITVELILRSIKNTIATEENDSPYFLSNPKALIPFFVSLIMVFIARPEFNYFVYTIFPFLTGMIFSYFVVTQNTLKRIRETKNRIF